MRATLKKVGRLLGVRPGDRRKFEVGLGSTPPTERHHARQDRTIPVAEKSATKRHSEDLKEEKRRSKEWKQKLDTERERSADLREKLQSARSQRDQRQARLERERASHANTKDVLSFSIFPPNDEDPNFRGAGRTIRRLLGKDAEQKYLRNSISLNLLAKISSGESLERALVDTCRAGLPGGSADISSILVTLERSENTRTAALLARMVLAERDGLYRYIIDTATALPRTAMVQYTYPEYLRALFEAGDVEECEAEINNLPDFDNLIFSDLERLFGIFNSFRQDTQARAIRSIAQGRRGDYENSAIFRWAERFDELMIAKNQLHARCSGEHPRLAIIDYKQPGHTKASTNVGDYTQTLAFLGNLARIPSIKLGGDQRLVEIVKGLQERVPLSRRLQKQDGSLGLELTLVDRDASSVAPPPPGTWMFAFGWYMHGWHEDAIDFPFHENINPIFISFHCNNPKMLDEKYVEYFKRHEPIGCRDWTTVYMLRSKGIRAFFSGCLTSTLDNIISTDPKVTKSAVAVVDAKVDNDKASEQIIQARDHVQWNDFFVNIEESSSMIEQYADRYAKIVTSRLHSFIPGIAIGSEVEFKPRNEADVRFEGLFGLNSETVSQIRDPLLYKIARITVAIASGNATSEVYELWRSICADDVDIADTYCATYKDIDLSVDRLKEIVGSVKQVEGFESPHTSTDSIEIAVSTDANQSPYVATLISSVVLNTQRDVNITILTRDLDVSAMKSLSKEIARKCGREISHKFFTCDDVDYGDIKGMLAHISVATMDRLLLPEILKDRRRVIYLDIDMIVLDDIEELWNMDLEGNPIGARGSISRGYSSLVRHVFRAATRLERERAWDLRRRTLHMHDLASTTFNAGLLVMDIEAMRGDDFCARFIPYATEFGLNDQEILNFYSASRWTELPEGWNKFPRQETLADAKLIHWIGPSKPWHSNAVYEKDKWEHYDNL